MYFRPHSGLTLCDKYDRNEKVVFYLSYVCITEFVLHIVSALWIFEYEPLPRRYSAPCRFCFPVFIISMTETRKWFLVVCICHSHTAFIIMEYLRNRFCHMFCPERISSSGAVGYKTKVRLAVLLTASVNNLDMNSSAFPYFVLTISVNI